MRLDEYILLLWKTGRFEAVHVGKEWRRRDTYIVPLLPSKVSFNEEPQRLYRVIEQVYFRRREYLPYLKNIIEVFVDDRLSSEDAEILIKAELIKQRG